MSTRTYKHTYVHSYGTVVGPTEKQGPLGTEFDVTFNDFYAQEKTYEMAERTMLRYACDQALQKGSTRMEDMDITVGGDLMNQLMTSHYFIRNTNVPFVGVYAACATSSLSMILAANFVESDQAKQSMAFVSSHFCTAEKQFRWPNEYGMQKKDTTTTTVTGAGSIIFSQQKNKIAVTSSTLGRVIDWEQKNANDMGTAMMPAAYDTLLQHLKDTGREIKDYDMIVTGDLSQIGHTMLIDALNRNNKTDLERISDCGLLIFDRENQDVFAGGSGAACSMVVTLGHLFKKLENQSMKRILLIATGALLSPVALQQHETIPCVGHAICFEAVNI